MDSGGAAKDRSAVRKFFIAASVAAAALHISSALIAGFKTPDYSQAQRAISDLGRAGRPYAFLVNYFGIAAPGLLILISALIAGKVLPSSKILKCGLVLMAAAGVSLIIAGFYPFPLPEHLLSALFGELLAACAIFSLSLVLKGGGSLSALAAFGIIISLFDLADAAIWVLAQGAHIRVHPLLGLEQRVASFSAFIWFGFFAAFAGRRPFKRG